MNIFEAEDGWPVGITKKGWLASEFDRAAASHRLSGREIELLLELVEATKKAGLAVTEIRRETFDHPELRPLFVRLAKILKWGQGLLLLSGFPTAEHSKEDIWRMYWGIGTHLGIQVSQNTFGQLMGEVTVTPGIKTGRVYGTSAMAPMHSDRIDMLSLLCINKAKSGGDNVFVSGLAVWEIIERERPDLFALLARGYHMHRNNEQAAGEPESTPYRVPIFGEVNGFRSTLFTGQSMLEHQQKRFPEELTEKDVEALTLLREVINRPELALRIALEPGEAVFINNMEMLHSRDAFEDGDTPAEKRLLLRMWLQGRPIRPKPDTMLVMRNPSGMLGIDPLPADVAASR